MKEIKLTKGQVTLVDNEDYETLNKFNWVAIYHRNTYYAQRRPGNKKVIHMHSVIMKTDKLLDHKDRNGLNNQKFNLRFCTHSQNKQNQVKTKKFCTSKYKGIILRKDTGQWRARITINNTRLQLGNFDSEHFAALIYNLAAMKYHKEFACLNQLPEKYEQRFLETIEILNRDESHALRSN